MGSAAGKSTTLGQKPTSERLEVILWFRRHNSTPRYLDCDRHGPLWFWMQLRLVCSSRVWFGIKDGERRQDMEYVAVDRRWLWLGKKRAKMREWTGQDWEWD